MVNVFALADRVLVGLDERDVGTARVPLSIARAIIAGLWKRAEHETVKLLLEKANVVALIGPWGDWHTFEVQVWHELGERVDPGLLAVLAGRFDVEDD